jgi:outer membrane protein OmpA-like peptidoglycan-associated protein
MIRVCAALFVLLSTPVWAFEFSLPVTARLTVERNTGPDTYTAPIGVFENGAVPMITVEGEVRRSAWRLDSPGLTPFQVMRPLRDQLVAEGFEVVLDCAADICGGFDFRFATETLPGPNMYVNIRAFHFVTGTRDTAGKGAEVVTLLASTAASSAYVQIIHAGGLQDEGVAVATDADFPVTTATSPGTSTGTAQGTPLLQDLLRVGHVVLSDLDFATGNTELGPGPFASLEQLAEFLVQEPALRIALVGHTDSVGGLEANIAISRERARAVRQRLIDRYAVAADRLDAEGMRYLAPIASNLDAAGREQNRRVEAVLLSQ